MKQEVINFQVPKELKEKAKEKARACGESLSTVLRDLLRTWSED